MNAAQLHLMTAHLPVVGVPFAIGLLGAGLIGRSETLWRAGCWALLVAAVLAAVPYFSGPPAYELVAARYGVASEPVERHAIVARGAALGLVLLGAVTLSALLRDWQGDRPGKVLRGVILAGAVGVAYALGWSAHLGGLVRHPELGEPSLRVFPKFVAAGSPDPAARPTAGLRNIGGDLRSGGWRGRETTPQLGFESNEFEPGASATGVLVPYGSRR